MDPAAADPKGLIRESYRIDGIGAAECRSIFLDWALSLPEDLVIDDAITLLIDHHGTAQPDHPMNAVLRAGLGMRATPRRRGGRSARVPGDQPDS